MKRTLLGALCVVVVPAVVAACGPSAASDLSIERLPDVEPNLPEVPTIPPPPFPTQYEDSSYSIYGLRRRMATTIDTELEVTGYIVEIYVPPECPEGQEADCPPAAAPHMWIADTRGEAERGKRLTVVGYAENQAQIDEAIEAAQRGHPIIPEEETGLLPIPTDFVVGAKIKLNGRFARVSGTGFNISDGLLEYRGHTITEPSPDAPPPPEE
jgi:hypothetical protein